MKTKAQIGMEYLMMIGFTTFIILIILGSSMLYSGLIKDKIKMNQLKEFSNKIITSAETIYYAGEPSKITIQVYVPEQVKSIEITSNEMIVTIETNTGTNKLSFPSNVPLEGTISTGSGLKNIQIIAKEDKVEINSV